MSDLAKELEKIAEDLGVDRKRSIGEVAKELKVAPHVIRFWEENFSQIKPEIGAGSRRYYYNKQLKILRRIKKFLHEDGYTISGLKKLLNKKNKDEFILETAANLDVVISDADFSLPSAQNPLTSSLSSPQNERQQSGLKKLEIDDFLLNQNEISLPNLKIDAKAKLLDFEQVKLDSNIDPALRFKINKKIEIIKNNLEKLKEFY
jgi:DNA-binding transcriptional MerR regulator